MVVDAKHLRLSAVGAVSQHTFVFVFRRSVRRCLFVIVSGSGGPVAVATCELHIRNFDARERW